ncbi:MAG: TolC family protein [Chitinivibrionales bacterium]|nr:TolC family protein [Chitinivibrionales bacterium]
MRIPFSFFPAVLVVLRAGFGFGEGVAARSSEGGAFPVHILEWQAQELSVECRHEAAVPEALDLATALSLALRHNPSLAACSTEIRAREAAALQAGLLPNPELEGEMGNLGGSNELRSLEGTEMTVGISQRVEPAGKRRKRRVVAEHEKQLAAWDYQIKKLDILAATATAFIEVLVAQKQVALNDELFDIANKTASAVSEKAAAGKISPVEKSRALIELAAARTDAAGAGRELEAARRRLAGFWGADHAAFSHVEGELNGLSTVPSEDSLKVLLPQNPDLARRRTAIVRSKARFSKARTEAVPDLTLRAGFKRSLETPDQTFMVGLSLPIPVFDRNRGGIKEARARMQKTKLEKEAAQIALSTALSDAWHHLAAAHAENVSLREEVLPAAITTYESTELGYREGKFDFLQMLDAQRTLFLIRQRYLDSLEECHLAAVEVERLTGMPVNNIVKKNSRSSDDKETKK